MNFEIIDQPMGVRPPVKMPHPDFYKLLKEDGIRSIVSNHYDCLKVSEIKHLFPQDAEGFEKAKKHSADFFVQMLGGPDYYNQNRGRPKLVDRHLPFIITSKGRIEWLECYKKVLNELDIPDSIVQTFWDYLNVFSLWMVNSENIEGFGFRIDQTGYTEAP